jgi:hypothetical protein
MEGLGDVSLTGILSGTSALILSENCGLMNEKLENQPYD